VYCKEAQRASSNRNSIVYLMEERKAGGGRLGTYLDLQQSAGSSSPGRVGNLLLRLSPKS
jgi:hypothetical protein